MNILIEVGQYLINNQSAFLFKLVQHVSLSLFALTIAFFIGFPLGVYLSFRPNQAQIITNLFNSFRIIPSIALLFLVLPYLGLGFKPSLLALTFLAIPPVLINTYTGIKNVDFSIVESAVGMGMTSTQTLVKIKLPLASQSIIAGLRTASVEVISSATLASFIGGGGLGDFITRGFALYNISIMLVGAIPIAFLALLSELFFSLINNKLSISEGV